MIYAYDLCGAEPIIKDMPVYDAAAIAYGELLMMSALSAANYTAGASGTGSWGTRGAVLVLPVLGVG